MDYQAYYDKESLHWTDIGTEPGSELTVEIEKAGAVDPGGTGKKKLALRYKGIEKKHIIPRRDVAPVIAAALGSREVKNWIGRKITLYVEAGSWFGGRETRAIRVRHRAPEATEGE